MSESKSSDREAAGKEIKEALRLLNQKLEKMGKDIQVVADKTQKYVEAKAPVVESKIDESMERASKEFKRMMSSLDKQTRPQQSQVLKNYKAFLEGQLTRVERRLEELGK